MKRIQKYCLVAFLIFVISEANSQNVVTRTNEFDVDFSDPNKLISTTIPVINWITPTAESSFVGENKYKIKFEIESAVPLKNIVIQIKESAEAASRGSQTVQPTEGKRTKPPLKGTSLYWKEITCWRS